MAVGHVCSAWSYHEVTQEFSAYSLRMPVMRRCVSPWIDMRPAGTEGTADVGGSPAWRSGERLTTATVKGEVVRRRGPGI